MYSLENRKLNLYEGNYYCEEINVNYPVIFKDNKFHVKFPVYTAQQCNIKVELELDPEYADYFTSLSLPISAITSFTIDCVKREVTRPSEEFCSNNRSAFRRTFPAAPALPNSAPFSRVRTNAGSFAILDTSIPPFSRAKYPSYVL